MLMEIVRHHVKEEERDFFPMVRAGLGRSALTDMGAALAAAKKGSHPSPSAGARRAARQRTGRSARRRG